MIGFNKVMRFCNTLQDYESAKNQGTITDDLFVVILQDKLAKFKGQTFDWSQNADLTALATKGELEDLAEEIASNERVWAEALNDLNERINEIGTGGGGGTSDIVVDAALSTTSTNAIQNKAVANALNEKADASALASKQDTLVSGTNIKTVQGQSILGSGNISISVPTVDAAFSSTSTNAVQNKVVKVAIDELQNKDTQIDAKQAELSAEINGLVGENDRHITFATNGNYENITSKIRFLKKGATIVNHGVAFIAYKDTARTESLTIRTGDTIIVDSDKRFMIAGSVGGTIDFDYKVTEALSNIEELSKEISHKTQVYDKALDLVSFDAREYEQGFYTSGVGFTASDYAISSKAYPVDFGDVINVFPNGETIQLFILNTDGITFTTLKSFSNVTEELTYQSEHKGYLRIVSRAGGQVIRPASAKVMCSIRKASAKEQEDALSKNGIYKSVLDKIPVKIINDSQDGAKMQFNNASIINIEGELYPKVVRINNGYVRYLNDVDMKNNHLTIRLRINSLSPGGYINVRVSNTDFPSNGYYYEIARYNPNTIIGLWQDFTIPCLSYQTPTENIAFDYINDIYVTVNNAEVDVQYIGIKGNPLKKGIVTFTFDDGFLSQLDAAKMMCKKGVQGTYFIIKSAVDSNASGYLTLSHLQQMAESYNSDIQVHGGSSFDDESDESLLSIFRDTQNMLKDNGISNGEYMSYPNGFHSERVVRLSRQFFKGCRTILQSIPMESYPPYDRYRMRSISGIVDSQVDKIKEYIDRCVENGTWLILTFHKIEETPSGSSNDGMYCSISSFETILNYAIDKANVMSMKEVMQTSYALSEI